MVMVMVTGCVRRVSYFERWQQWTLERLEVTVWQQSGRSRCNVMLRSEATEREVLVILVCLTHVESAPKAAGLLHVRKV